MAKKGVNHAEKSREFGPEKPYLAFEISHGWLLKEPKITAKRSMTRPSRHARTEGVKQNLAFNQLKMPANGVPH